MNTRHTINNSAVEKTISFIPYGFTARKIDIEGTITQGLPNFNIVGMGARTVSEARDRVRSALKNSGFLFPDSKLTINLAPADLEKDGTFLDLPIAINILLLSNQLRLSENIAFVGELSLDGSLRPVRGIINIVEAAKKHHISTLFLPEQNFAQGSIMRGVKLIPARSLLDIFLYLKGEKSLPQTPNQLETPNQFEAPKTSDNQPGESSFDLIVGQAIAKRAMLIAVAGHHNILLSGPPGTGKTMLARAGVELLPKLSFEESISVTKLHSIAGLTSHIVTTRPFRTPHHTSSLPSLIGGGPKAMPGEISLAHLGALFLDELPEYQKTYLEALRQPLEDRKITISRVKGKTTYPADFMLIATMNPCPCGYLGDKSHPCSCTKAQIDNYHRKLSGPLLDRIDIFAEMSRPKTAALLSSVAANTTANSPPASDKLRRLITTAIDIQKARFNNSKATNASVSSAELLRISNLTHSAKTLLGSAADKLNLSARSYFKVIRVARTIADLEQSPEIKPPHISEALTFRQK